MTAQFTMSPIREMLNPDAPGVIVGAMSQWGSVVAECCVLTEMGYIPAQVEEEFSRKFHIYFLGHAGHA